MKKEIIGIEYDTGEVIAIYGTATPSESEESFKQRLRQLGWSEEEIKIKYENYYIDLIKYPSPMIVTRRITIENSETSTTPVGELKKCGIIFEDSDKYDCT